jgi:hypothetical protein
MDDGGTMTTKTFWIAAGLLAGAAAMKAQKIDVKLGLWEVNTSTETKGMPAMPGMDTSKMPPETRERIEAMMKARQAKAPQSHTRQDCITQEKLDKDIFQAENERETACKRTEVSNTRTTRHYKIECNSKQQMTGEAEFTATSRESMTGWFKIMMNPGGTSPMTINTNISAKWLGAACGDIK